MPKTKAGNHPGLFVHTTIPLLFQRADVLHQILDLVGSQLAIVRGHRAPAFINDLAQVAIGLFLHIGRTQVADVQIFADLCIPGSP